MPGACPYRGSGTILLNARVPGQRRSSGATVRLLTLRIARSSLSRNSPWGWLPSWSSLEFMYLLTRDTYSGRKITKKLRHS